jgi:hypothetical protein
MYLNFQLVQLTPCHFADLAVEVIGQAKGEWCPIFFVLTGAHVYPERILRGSSIFEAVHRHQAFLP